MLGIREFSNNQTDLAMVHDVPAMSSDFLPDRVITLLHWYYVHLESVPLNFYITSVSKELTRIPLQDPLPLADRQYVQPPFLPQDLLAENVGANIGLLEILENIRAERQESKSRLYNIIVTDINIYNRILKVIIS